MVVPKDGRTNTLEPGHYLSSGQCHIPLAHILTVPQHEERAIIKAQHCSCLLSDSQRSSNVILIVYNKNGNKLQELFWYWLLSTYVKYIYGVQLVALFRCQLYLQLQYIFIPSSQKFLEKYRNDMPGVFLNVGSASGGAFIC